MPPARYILKNISKNDINLGDLRYKIPAGQIRNLLSKTARLNWKDIEKSKNKGSIAVRLGKTLIEIKDVIEPVSPKINISKDAVIFPRNVKSSIILEMNDVSEEVNEISISEENEFLKELDLDLISAPVIAAIEEKEEENFKGEVFKKESFVESFKERDSKEEKRKKKQKKEIDI